MSYEYSLSKSDLIKLGKGALIAIGGAVLTYGSSIITKIDFGEFTPIVVSVFSIAINACRKYVPATEE